MSIGRLGCVPVGVHHLHPGALPRHTRTTQQAAERVDVVAQIRPAGWCGTQCAGAGETGAERDRNPAGRQRGQRRCGRGVDHRVAQGRYEHAGTQADGGGAFGRQREHHPHVGAFVRCVEQPGPVIAEFFGNRDVRGGLQRGRELGGDLHWGAHLVSFPAPQQAPVWPTVARPGPCRRRRSARRRPRSCCRRTPKTKQRRRSPPAAPSG